MMQISYLTEIAGIYGPFVLVTALLLNLSHAVRHFRGSSGRYDRKTWHAVITAISLAVVFVPSKGIFLFEYFKGLFGYLSVTTMLLLTNSAIRHLFSREVLMPSERSAILHAIAIGGIILYPTALGLSPVDIYRLGYQPLLLLLLLLILTLSLWGLKKRGVALSVTLAVIAFTLFTLESENIWDYLTDPFVTLYAWGWNLLTSFPRKRESRDLSMH